jgi:hypothetical protein
MDNVQQPSADKERSDPAGRWHLFGKSGDKPQNPDLSTVRLSGLSFPQDKALRTAVVAPHAGIDVIG